MTKPTLAGEMVTLRPLAARDADAAWHLANDPEGRRLTGATAELTRADVEDWCATAEGVQGRFDWAVTAGGSEEMLGEIVLADLNPDAASGALRMAVRPGHRGRGYAREAIMLVLRYAFAPRPAGLGLHRVGLDVLSINPRAFALYESLGFVTEGRLRDAHRDGQWYCDTIVMGMLEDDFALASETWR